MVEAFDLDRVISRFRTSVAGGADSTALQTEVLVAPHRPSQLPPGWQGVYAFRFRDVWLKVGKAGPQSGSRWLSQHYNPGSSQSNLAWALVRYAHFETGRHPRLPPDFRKTLSTLGPDEIGSWIKENTERCNVLITAKLGRDVLSRLEEIAVSELNPMFEGRWRDELAG